MGSNDFLSFSKAEIQPIRYTLKHFNNSLNTSWSLRNITMEALEHGLKLVKIGQRKAIESHEIYLQGKG